MNVTHYTTENLMLPRKGFTACKKPCRKVQRLTTVAEWTTCYACKKVLKARAAKAKKQPRMGENARGRRTTRPAR